MGHPINPDPYVKSTIGYSIGQEEDNPYPTQRFPLPRRGEAPLHRQQGERLQQHPRVAPGVLIRAPCARPNLLGLWRGGAVSFFGFPENTNQKTKRRLRHFEKHPYPVKAWCLHTDTGTGFYCHLDRLASDLATALAPDGTFQATGDQSLGIVAKA